MTGESVNLAASESAKDVGLTIGTHTASAYITGYEIGQNSEAEAHKIIASKLTIAVEALTELSYEHETSLYRHEMYEIAKEALAKIQGPK